MAGQTVGAWMPWGMRKRLDVFVEAGREARRQFAAGRRPEKGLTLLELAQWRAKTAKLLAAERRAGRILDTKGAVLEYGARLELAERGWDQAEFPDVPDWVRLSGRWPGSRDGGYPDQLVTRVDPELAERVLRACWAHSGEAVLGVLAWREQNPDVVYDVAELERYDAFSAQIITPGDLWRAGLRRVVPWPHADSNE
jgi:hypothetical protein